MSCDDYSPARDNQQIGSSVRWSRGGRRRRGRRRVSSPVGSSEDADNIETQHYKLRTRFPADVSTSSPVADRKLVSDHRAGQTSLSPLLQAASTASLLTPSPRLDPPSSATVPVPMLPQLTVPEPTPPETPELGGSRELVNSPSIQTESQPLQVIILGIVMCLKLVTVLTTPLYFFST